MRVLEARVPPGVRPAAVPYVPAADVPAVVTVVVDVTLFSSLVFGGPDRTSGLPAVAFAVAGLGLLMLRHRAPLAVLTALAAHAAIACALSTYRPVLLVAAALATVVTRCRPAVVAASALPAAAAVTAWVLDEAANHPGANRVGVAAGYSALLLAAAAFGLSRRITQQRLALADRRDAAAREAVAAERARVARELHDIVAHAVTVMTLQAAGARRVLRHEPARAEDALAAVEDQGVQAVEELRRLLGALRQPDGTADTRTTQPGLTDLEPLVASVRRAGVHVQVCRSGTPARLDQSVDVAAYRVLQEALTNVTKHAGAGTSVRVDVAWSPRELRLEVRDDGRGTRPRGALSTGHGLVGLAERVAIVGGVLTTGRREGGGFRLTATVPTASARSDVS
ncbi:MAG TPA: histidine kinase [Mycobacteriales bacterium]